MEERLSITFSFKTLNVYSHLWGSLSRAFEGSLGSIAQLIERWNMISEVVGSSPATSARIVLVSSVKTYNLERWRNGKRTLRWTMP